MTDVRHRNSAKEVVATAFEAPGGERVTPRTEIRHRGGRQIGPIGTMTRLVLGVGFLAWALVVPHRHPLFDLPAAGSRVWGVVVGLVVLPALITGVVWARGRSAAPLRLSSGAACLVTGVVVLAANVAPIAVLTFIGATMLLLAAVGRGGCEVVAVPNLVLGRHDYLACLGVSEIDAWERRHARDRRARSI